MTAKEQEFLENFRALETWAERFNYLIELGEQLPSMPDELKTSNNRIHSCTSRTYFAVLRPGGKLRLHGWSNAAIPSGIMAMLRLLYDGCSTEEAAGASEFIQQSGLLENLSLSRREGLLDMVERLID